MESDLLWIVPSFFAVALVYSTVGLGGGSSYLALLALSAVPYPTIAPIALTCNLLVASSGLYFFRRSGCLSLKQVLPFVATSIPAAYWGGTVALEKETFTWLLGVSLAVAAFRLFLSDRAFASKEGLTWKRAWIVGIPVGSILGFWSGLVGIGGGIFLAPLLLLIGWADAKQAAAASSLFIIVNSAAGLAGHLARGTPEFSFLMPLLAAVFFGGQIGSRLGSRRISKLVLQRVTAILILAVSVRLLWKVAVLP